MRIYDVGQPWSEIQEAVDKFWSNTPSDSDVIETWDRSVADAMKEIQESVAKLPEKDRDVQAKIRWQDWQEKNDKPKIVDQIERYHKSLKLTPISQKEMQEINDFLEAYRAEREATPPDELKKRDEMLRMQIDPKVVSSVKEWWKKQNGK